VSALLVLGGGGHGRVVADAVLDSGAWQRVAFLDDFVPKGTDLLGLPVVGSFRELEAHVREFAAAIVAIGEARRRLDLIAACLRVGFKLATVVHPAAHVSRFATLGPGTVVLAQAAINAGATLGVGCIVNTGSTIDHDCKLGQAVHVCPGAHLAGSVHVGDAAWIGVGSSVRDGIAIGARVMVGAGAVVVDDVPDGVTVVGVPARQRVQT
jgi:sugar O-acyltransferase (sialic acid O-acetyltransferase NeuD family)